VDHACTFTSLRGRTTTVGANQANASAQHHSTITVIRFAARLLVCHVQYRICILEVCREGANGFAAALSADRFSVCALRALLYLIIHGKGSLFSGTNYIKRSDFQGIVSPTSTGVSPNCTRNFSLTVFSSAWGILPQSISTSLPLISTRLHDLSWNDASQCILRLPSWRFASPPFNWTLQISEIALRP
jgi:hypothetical protein